VMVALVPPTEEVAIMRRANAVRGLVSWPFAVLGAIVALQFASKPLWALVSFYACLLPVRFVFGLVARRMELPAKSEWKEMVAPKDPLFWPLSIGVAVVTVVGIVALQIAGHGTFGLRSLLVIVVGALVLLNAAQWLLLLAGGLNAR
jgi:hypothetical protein